MKTVRTFGIMFPALMVLALLIAGCGQLWEEYWCNPVGVTGGGDNGYGIGNNLVTELEPDYRLIGSWRHHDADYEYEIVTFNSGRTSCEYAHYEYQELVEEYSGTFAVKGDQLTITWDGEEEPTETWTYLINEDGDVMTLSCEGETTAFYRIEIE